MSRPTLAQLLIESAKKAEEEREFNKRVAAIAKPEIDKILAQHKAETSQTLSCPHCNEPLPEGWRTDPVTGDSTENDDDVNEQDDDEDVDQYDNRRITRLNNMAKSLAAASNKGSSQR